MTALIPLSAQDVAARLKSGEAVLIDVRNADEFAREHIEGAVLVPLTALDASSLPLGAGQSVIFTCRSGQRTLGAAARLAARVAGDAYVLQGGLDGWKAAGLATVVDHKQPLELMRQVQIAAGSLVLIGVVLGTLVHPGFYGLSAFVGAGLTFAGISGFCGMANLLMLMPWNRKAGA